MPHAFVVGIDRFSSARIPSLACAVNDAEEVSRRLDSAGFEVVTLTNEAATRRAVEAELDGGLNQRVADADDPVLIYWSGHGMSDLRENADSDRGWSTFLLPFDADIDQPLTSAFPVQQVWALLNRLRSRRLLVMLDTCFSGAFANDSRGFSIGARGGATPPTGDFLQLEGYGRAVITACGPDEVARESDRHGHGHFTRAVLSVLERGVDGGDRQARVTALTSAIRDEVRRETRGAQTPFLHASQQGSDWSIPLPPPAPYQPPMPSWAFVGTSGGVGKTTLAMMTAELLAESGNTVLYLDADIAHHGGTSEWCQRAKVGIGQTRTFADHVAVFSRAKTRRAPERHLTDRLIDVTPEYLRRYDCGRILLLTAARPADRLFVFDLVAEIKDRRSNDVCRQILDAAFDRGVRQGATSVVVDCGAQFDPLAVNCIASAHHPFVVAAARAGAKDQRETILSNCAQTVEDFNRLRVETVVNRVPSREALVQHWGEPDYGRGLYYHWLPFDRKLFQDWEEGRPNFELGYDDLTHAWHEILVASDRTSCDGLHRDLLPDEWDRFSKWALWLHNSRGWAETQRDALSRAIRRSFGVLAVYLATLGVSLTSMLLHLSADRRDGGPSDGGQGVPAPADDASFLPQWLAITLVVLAGAGVLGNAAGRMLLRRRRRVLDEVIRHSDSADTLRRWFSVPSDEGPWWKVWQSSRRAAIEWLHRQVVAAREGRPSADPSAEATV